MKKITLFRNEISSSSLVLALIVSIFGFVGDISFAADTGGGVAKADEATTAKSKEEKDPDTEILDNALKDKSLSKKDKDGAEKAEEAAQEQGTGVVRDEEDALARQKEYKDQKKEAWKKAVNKSMAKCVKSKKAGQTEQERYAECEKKHKKKYESAVAEAEKAYKDSEDHLAEQKKTATRRRMGWWRKIRKNLSWR